MASRTNGLSDQLLVGQIGCRTNGLLEKWLVGQMACRTDGLSDKWVVGEMGCRRNGLSDKWQVGEMARRHVWPCSANELSSYHLLPLPRAISIHSMSSPTT